jgi:hypothetical protein
MWGRLISILRAIGVVSVQIAFFSGERSGLFKKEVWCPLSAFLKVRMCLANTSKSRKMMEWRPFPLAD